MNVRTFHAPNVRAAYPEVFPLFRPLGGIFSDIERNWCAVRGVLVSASMDHLGPPGRTHQDWFDQNNT